MEQDKRVLLHICCAPCSIYPVKELTGSGYSVTGYWFNPNIQGYREYSRRLMTLGYYARKSGLDIFEEPYNVEEWFAAAGGGISVQRCRDCYKLRIDRTAREAASRGYGFFSTTLLYSRFQDHDAVKEAAGEASARHGVEFLYEDFREGWKEGIRISRSMGLYRQQYCGCIFSEIERYDVSEKSQNIRV